MPSAVIPSRPRSTLFTVLALWFLFYASFTLFRPALLDDADSVHVEVAREMLLRHDFVTLYANGIRYLEKAPLLYWSMAASMRLAMLLGAHRPETLAAAARLPLALSVLALALCCESLARRLFHTTRAGLYGALILLSGFGFFIFTRITIPDALVCLWITVSLWCFWRTEELEHSHNRVQQGEQGRVPHPLQSKRWDQDASQSKESQSIRDNRMPHSSRSDGWGWWSLSHWSYGGSDIVLPHPCAMKPRMNGAPMVLAGSRGVGGPPAEMWGTRF